MSAYLDNISIIVKYTMNIVCKGTLSLQLFVRKKVLLRRKSGSKIDYLRLNMDPNSWSERTSTQQRHSFGRGHQLLQLLRFIYSYSSSNW